MRNTLFVLLSVLLCAASARAQAVSGTIYGTVRDPSEAAVAEAALIVRNIQTNYSRTQTSGPDGGFRFASLPLGTYALTVERAGFSQFVQQGLVLQVDQQVRLDITLRVGSVNEQVVVTAEAPLVNATNSETSAVVDRQRVENLPLNGRNFVQLIQLTTGTTPGAPGDSQNNVVINLFRGPSFFTANGMRNMYNNYVLDGVDNNENAFNSGGIVILPVIDAIQEFKVSTGNFSSEFGRAVGGVVNVQTRSGTNEFHGNLFEFLRNSSLDANDFFNNRAGQPKPPFRQSQFGGTFGGPIRKDSLFVFADYQGLRQRRGLTYLGSVAPEAARGGDFSNLLFPVIYDPLTTRNNPTGSGSTRDPLPNRRVPSNRIDTLAPQFLSFMPMPNTNLNAIALNFINNPMWSREDNQGDIRVDKNLGARGTLFGRYSYDKAAQLFPNEMTTTENPFGGGGRTNDLAIIAQNAALNLTYLQRSNLVFEARLGFSRFVFDGRAPGAGSPLGDRLQVPGSRLSEAANVPPGVSIAGLTSLLFNVGGLPNLSTQNTYQAVFNTTWTRGSHTVKTGLDLRRRQRNNFINSAPPAGVFSFSAAHTNQTGAGAGGVGLASFLLGMPSGIRRGYVQGPVGRRNSEWGAYVQDDWKVTSNLTVNLGVRYELFTPITEVADRISILDFNTGRLILPSANGPLGRGLRHADRNNLAPRVGFSWRAGGHSDLVVRAGYGMSFIEEFGANGFNSALNPPYAYIQDLSYSTIQPPPVRLAQGVPLPGVIDVNKPFGQIRMVDPLAVAAYAQQWNLSLQKSFAGNWLVDAGYVGTRGVKLLLNTDPNQPVPGPGAIPNRRPLFAVAPDVTTSMAQSFGKSNYHSFQLKVEKRLSHGMYLVSSYTLSKTIDDGLGNFGNGVPGVGSMGTAQDSLNRSAERALADTNQLQRLVLSYGWDLPFGKGRRFLNHGPVRWIAGGWQLAGITTLASGNPFDMLFNPSTLNTGGAQRPDRIADGRLDTWTIDRYFDVSAFRAPAAFVYGNSGRNILRGPGVNTWDLSALKDTRIRERYNLQYRADFFNAFNRPQFNAPGNTIGTPQAGLVSSTRFSTNRQIQFVLKLFF